ncbi:MAG: acyltransferase domain-containing protein [Lewinellaceae bacterium]|nr:acyltransferase domain-containing protein [Lewinellaceae bacterium]
MNINSSLRKTPIAVVGLSAIFADARNVEEFWNNIVLAKDSITDVPENRWRIEDYYDPDMNAPDKTYCKRGGFLPEIDFNPMEFGLPPNILEVTDASQLLALVAARDALLDAGYGPDSEKFTKALREKTGVVLGVGGGQKLITPLIARLQYPIWERALRASGVAEEDIPHIVDKMKKAYVSWNENAFPGLLGNVISGRITNRFDLGGINSVVDAACAASLSAIKMALSELVEGRCDMMLTGGVDTDNSPFMYMSFSKTPAFSKSGNISPFSDKADGMLIGEGLGMLVLKRLEDAERDGDRIYAVVKGVGTSSDGRFKSVYAPRPSGQALAMNRAYEDAGYAPSTVGLIEAHGTGTGAGDPTEFSSMQMVFGKEKNEKKHIALGSVKSQIGHTKAAAGAAGMIKAVLALHHKVLPPTINVERPNSKFDMDKSPVYINTETRPWLRNGHPRRASVSAFGFGGINVHITMEEYEGKKPADYRLHEPFKTVLIQASTPSQLLKYCQETLDRLQSDNAEVTFSNLVEDSKNTKPERPNARLGFVTQSPDECAELLQLSIQTLQKNQEAWNHPRGICYRPNGIDPATQKVVALFSGQGSQYVGMGGELANAFPEVHDAFGKMDNLFRAEGEAPLSETVFPVPVFSEEERKAQQQALTQTRFAQPAIGALSMGMYKVMQRAGFQPDFAAGHSFGELTALWAAGVFDEDTFLALAKKRGAAMSAAGSKADPGAMLAVKASEAEVRQAINDKPGVSIANVNSNDQIVIGGSTAAIKAAGEQLQAQGFSVVSLPVSAAFHTAYVKHAQEPFARFVHTRHFNKPAIPVYANTTGLPYPDNAGEQHAILEEQILNPVLFRDQVENIYQAGGRIFVEFGPKDVLSKLVQNILQNKEHIALGVNPNARKDSDLQFRQAALQLRVLGLPLNHVDPYKKERHAASAKTRLNVTLSGNNYVSAPTQQAYQEALNDGFRIAGGQPKIIEKIVEVEKVVEVPAEKEMDFQNENEEEAMNKEALKVLQAALESFNANQTKSLEIFERFLSEQNQQAQQLLQLISRQVEGPQSTEKSAPLSNGFVKPDPTPTTPANGNGANGHAKKVAAPAVPQPKVEVKVEAENRPAAEAPASNNATDTSKLEKALLEVVSEKTGYPAEMLELSMDMEADLGIDSIKRVEIFGALTAQHPEMSGINPNELTELRTLGQIVEYVGAKGGTAVARTKVEAEVKVENRPAAEAPASNNATDTSKLEKALLEVVSEKTGYPAEMLELSMDMEADLGIDSIKRVEIFGALTAQHPEMSGINPNELTELRTLGQIVEYVGAKGGTAVARTKVEAEVKVENRPAAEAPASNNATDTSKLEKALLEVVSEKTGYPAEMLELSMDMEADLGIDSIKRVEIFGALTAQHPEMSGINPNELTELRTLGQIVDYVGKNGKKKLLV